MKPSAPSSTAGTPKIDDGPQNTRSLSATVMQRGVEIVPVAGALLDGDDRVEIGEARDQRRRQRVHRIAGNIVEEDRQPRLADDVAVVGEDLVIGQLHEIGRQDQDAVGAGLLRHVGELHRFVDGDRAGADDQRDAARDRFDRETRSSARAPRG